ncbi:MAG: RIP metalloprotease RseP [Gammaproteobacteria bacterium CG_4_10_14_0_8_um_filter_38_16]|nr:MAG: RIP metalloprotease RseP [Gammaproteobacteria bacterium CG_4_10_14_0_8_um_filter_38_16]PJA04022.1 MAG: RIP metalloprotease RseP [Gammaproteobacteria bacterium CG_4_10_14_0_2_um_filter_38_22]PJB10481.1 MAG: RIP metalloprotease RseP [Gammaproteobacteria bacterium CG_4_9_14_3_um_filter_38_9]
MSILISILGAVFAFFLVVLVHEYGHFIVARWMGIKVLRFSIGFGRPLFLHRAKSGVEYAIGFLPLGGYVKMQDAFSPEDESVGSKGVAFEKKSVWVRAAVVVAGPLANIILAMLFFTVIYIIGVTHLKPIVSSVMPNSIAARAHLNSNDEIIQAGSWQTRDWTDVVMQLIMHVGDKKPLMIMASSLKTHRKSIYALALQHWKFNPAKPDILSSIGIKPYFPIIPAVVGSILPHSPAQKSTLRLNDRVLRIDHHWVASWQSLVQWVAKHPNQRVLLTVLRDHHKINLFVKIGARKKNKKLTGYLGVAPKTPVISNLLKTQQQYSVFKAGFPAFEQTKRWVIFHFVIIKQMLLGHISLKALSGPISIFETAGSASLAGITAYLQFIAFISVVLGVINILPIPALDGGHLLFCVIEGVTRRPIPMRLQVLLINLGVIFLVTLMVYATMNDFIRLLS